MQNNKSYKIIGLMSGTSLDGLDMAYTHLWKEDDVWHYALKAKKSISYTAIFRQKLKESVALSGMGLMELDVMVGQKMGDWVKAFMDEEELVVDFIASHGHTIFHQVDKGFTTQIGNAHHIKRITGVPVIADFRYEDVVLGGQGAPLVPIGDQVLFSEYDFCLNLGGISNISFNQNGSRTAFDIGPANMLLNNIIQPLGLAYDDGGKRARSGRLITEVKKDLDALDYYAWPIPKSLGYEWFQEEVEPLIARASEKYDIVDILCTAVHHVAEQVREHIDRFADHKNGRLMVSGGGAFNTFLMDVLREKLAPKIELVIPPADLIEYKEAIVFALMAAMRLEGENNILSSVTGADRDSSAGVMHN